MEQSSWESESHLAVQVISCLLSNAYLIIMFTIARNLDPVFWQMNPGHVITHCFCNVCLNVTLPFTFTSPEWPLSFRISDLILLLLHSLFQTLFLKCLKNLKTLKKCLFRHSLLSSSCKKGRHLLYWIQLTAVPNLWITYQDHRLIIAWSTVSNRIGVFPS
jgi:hypothetical protein